MKLSENNKSDSIVFRLRDAQWLHSTLSKSVPIKFLSTTKYIVVFKLRKVKSLIFQHFFSLYKTKLGISVSKQ